MAGSPYREYCGLICNRGCENKADAAECHYSGTLFRKNGHQMQENKDVPAFQKGALSVKSGRKLTLPTGGYALHVGDRGAITYRMDA